MGRASVKENKTIYQKRREARGLTRAQASEAMQWVTESRIEKIESEKTTAAPEEVLAMVEAYRSPDLCNYYCSHECAIGRGSVREVRERPIEAIVLEMLDTLNHLEKYRDRLIEITSDGVIHDDQIEDFARIRRELARMGAVVDSMQLWFDTTVAEGKINADVLKTVSGDDGSSGKE